MACPVSHRFRTPGAAVAAVLVLLGAASGPARAGARPSDPLAVPAAAVTTRTVLTGDVTGGPEPESVALVEFLVPDKKGAGVGLLLGVYSGEGSDRKLLWSRDYGALTEGAAAGGTLSLVDLDGDDRPEIIVTWQKRRADTLEETGEILRPGADGFGTAWSGVLRVDTSAAKDVPVDKRERFIREIDVGKTLKTHGGLLFVNKTVALASGVPLDPPRQLVESFPLGLNVSSPLTGAGAGGK